MGNNGHYDNVQVVKLPRRDALAFHLQNNHFPPISQAFIPIAEEAIDKANDGDHDTMIRLPNGRTLPVHMIIEGLHLDCFLNKDEE